MRGRVLVAGALGLALGAAAAVGALAVLRPTAPLSGSRYAQGRAVAERLGCFACHGPDGKAGTTNFLPELDEVPAWGWSTFKSYVRSPAELREWVLDGRPSRMKDDAQEQARIAAQLIQMPAYRSLLRPGELEVLEVYLLAVSTFLPLEEESAEARGREVASRLGCLGCHGGEGRAQPPNPGSLKGYIPSWDSDDFDELVRTPAELREWVLRGAPARLLDNPAAAFFLQRQTVKMPAYDKQLSGAELDDLVAYVQFVRQRR